MILPTRAISAIPTDSASVTRKPLTNCVFLPALPSIAVISGPPPCTTTGRNPAHCRKTISCSTLVLISSLSIALPPYFTTTVFPLKSRRYGSASTKVLISSLRNIDSSSCFYGSTGPWTAFCYFYKFEAAKAPDSVRQQISCMVFTINFDIFIAEITGPDCSTLIPCRHINGHCDIMFTHDISQACQRYITVHTIFN